MSTVSTAYSTPSDVALGCDDGRGASGRGTRAVASKLHQPVSVPFGDLMDGDRMPRSRRRNGRTKPLDRDGVWFECDDGQVIRRGDRLLADMRTKVDEDVAPP